MFKDKLKRYVITMGEYSVAVLGRGPEKAVVAAHDYFRNAGHTFDEDVEPEIRTYQEVFEESTKNSIISRKLVELSRGNIVKGRVV